MIFADKLILLRKKAGWSQEELADQMNVTRQSVSKWEGAQSVPDLEKMLRLSELFGVSTDYLLNIIMTQSKSCQSWFCFYPVVHLSVEVPYEKTKQSLLKTTIGNPDAEKSNGETERAAYPKAGRQN